MHFLTDPSTKLIVRLQTFFHSKQFLMQAICIMDELDQNPFQAFSHQSVYQHSLTSLVISIVQGLRDEVCESFHYDRCILIAYLHSHNYYNYYGTDWVQTTVICMLQNCVSPTGINTRWCALSAWNDSFYVHEWTKRENKRVFSGV